MEINDKCRKQDGMTLVELIVVLILLIPMLLPILYALERSMRTSDQVYRLTTSAFLAQQKMEEVRTRISCYTSQTAAAPGIINYCPPSYSNIVGPNCPNRTRKNNLNFDFSQPIGLCPNLKNVEFTTCDFPSPFTNFKCEVLDRFRLKDYVYDIQVRVWYDENPNATFDPGETAVTFQTDITYHAPAWNY